MTTIVVVRVEDGAVMASDSAITLTNETGEVERSYAGAAKVFELRDDPSVAIAGYGCTSSPPEVSQHDLVGELRRRAQGLGDLAEGPRRPYGSSAPPTSSSWPTARTGRRAFSSWASREGRARPSSTN